MQIRFDKHLRLWLDVAFGGRESTDNMNRREFYRATLREWEAVGEAMRYLDCNGNIAWKASPRMLERLADQEREARNEMEDEAI